MLLLLQRLAEDTRVITYLMTLIGVLGILAKIVNQFTLHRLVKAAGNMPKSTHRLIKLVRAKYEHACMIRDSVENIDAFVEKYIYEYRGFLFRIHTWRQIEMLSVWFAGILAVLGASVLYFYSGFSESVYQYIAGGIAEVILLSVVIRLTDESYEVSAVKMYMTDYLENICTFRLRRQSQREREFIDVISGEGGKAAFQQTGASRERGFDSLEDNDGFEEVYPETDGSSDRRNMRDTGTQGKAGIFRRGEVAAAVSEDMSSGTDRSAAAGRKSSSAPEKVSGREKTVSSGADAKPGKGLAIQIEGEPRSADSRENVRRTARHGSSGSGDDDRPALREEAIRQILEEFLA